MNRMKRQKDRTLKDELPRSVGTQNVTGDQWRNNYRKIEEPYKADVHDPENHDGVITHLGPDILECEVKWALGSITMNKLVEVMEFQLSYSKS